MPILKKTAITGSVVALLSNLDGNDLTTEACESVELDFGGIISDAHHGLTRASCVRVQTQYKKGTRIRNTRQITVLSDVELAHIAQTIGVAELNPSWLGANVVLRGIPRLTKLPPSSRLIFDNGVSLVIDMENAPCRYPGEVIEQHYPGKGGLFAKAAVGFRGVTAWVEFPGQLHLASTVCLHIPPPVEWNFS